jgi:hypothetical protein
MRDLPSPTRGLTLESHDSLSSVLVGMAMQSRNLRTLLRGATGRHSAPAQAADTLYETVGHLQRCLLAVLDQDFGEDAPPMVRTRYSSS